MDSADVADGVPHEVSARVDDNFLVNRGHFLRTFERLTGITPHQYVMRTRLREAAIRLTPEFCRGTLD